MGTRVRSYCNYSFSKIKEKAYLKHYFIQFQNQLKLAMKISTCNVDEIEIDQYSSDLKELIKKILSKEPAQRPSAREILNHELFSSKAS